MNMAQGRFKLGPVAGQSSNASVIAKNTFGPVGIPLTRGALGSRRYSPTEGGKAWGYGPPRPEELSSAEAHPAEPPRVKTAYRMRLNNWRGQFVERTLSGLLWMTLQLRTISMRRHFITEGVG